MRNGGEMPATPWVSAPPHPTAKFADEPPWGLSGAPEGLSSPYQGVAGRGLGRGMPRQAMSHPHISRLIYRPVGCDDSCLRPGACWVRPPSFPHLPGSPWNGPADQWAAGGNFSGRGPLQSGGMHREGSASLSAYPRLQGRGLGTHSGPAVGAHFESGVGAHFGSAMGAHFGPAVGDQLDLGGWPCQSMRAPPGPRPAGLELVTAPMLLAHAGAPGRGPWGQTWGFAKPG